MSSDFLRFQYLVLNDESWHLVNFFTKIPTRSQDIGARILALLGQKVTHWMKLLLWKQIYVSRTLLKHFIFHFLKIWVELYKKKQILTFLCLLLSRNHGPKPQKSEFSSKTLRLHISYGHHLHILFSGFCESHLGVLILCRAKIMCKQGPGTEWSLKIQFLFKNCFVTRPIMAAALGLVQNVNTL